MKKYAGVMVLTLALATSSIFAKEEGDGLSPAEIEALRQHDKGTSALLTKKYDEAIFYFKKAIELNSEFTEAYYNLGVAYEELERFKEAIPVLERAVQLNSAHANAYYALGYAHFRLKDYQTAVKAFEQSINLKPDNAFAHSKIGHAFVKMGNKEAARSHYEILKTLDSALAAELYREINRE